MGLTKEEIAKVKKINSCLEPEFWTKGMYDAFLLGFRLGVQE